MCATAGPKLELGVEGVRPTCGDAAVDLRMRCPHELPSLAQRRPSTGDVCSVCSTPYGLQLQVQVSVGVGAGPWHVAVCLLPNVGTERACVRLAVSSGGFALALAFGT